MISSQTEHVLPGFDEKILDSDGDFLQTGLKSSSVIRTTRVAVVAGEIVLGAIGNLPVERLKRIQTALANWILGDSRGT
jgi:mRNA interferase MazF